MITKEMNEKRISIFTWENREQLQFEVENAGREYREEAARVKMAKKGANLFSASSRFLRGLPVDPVYLPFVVSMKRLQDLMSRCVKEEGLHMTLVSLTSLPEDEKFAKERSIRVRNFERAKAMAENR